jgi:RNA polymerase sigma-70 factor (ECF subfamily)
MGTGPIMPPAIEELADRATRGDTDAFDQLIRTQLARLEKHVGRRLGDRVRGLIECDDVLQETMLKACGAIQNFVWYGEEAFFRWLARIAEHVIWKASQKKSPPKLVVEVTADDRTTPMTRAARKERAGRLERAIADLSEDHRRVIRMTRLEGCSIAQVAEAMARTPNAVKKLLARALEQLRKRYGDTTGSLLMVSPFPAQEPTDGE